MYKRIICAAFAAFLFCVSALADNPFRNHRYDAIDIMPVHQGDIVFVGNSITNMHEWWEAFGCQGNILNRGVSGCVSAETLENIGSVIAGHPAKVFLMVGTNDLGDTSPEVPYRVAANVAEIVSRFKEQSPETELYIQSVLPVGETNRRTPESLMTLNSLYKDICEREGVTYVDLWSLMVEPGTTHINPAYTKDGLHLYPSGYRVWCNAIAPLVGAECVYEDVPFNDCGIDGSFAMRAAAFDLLPLDGDDIVMMGDEMIHGGEWHELLGSPRVKNRGSCWGFGGPSLEVIGKQIPAIFSSEGSPESIYLHAGAAEVNKGMPIDTLEARYRRLVSAIVEAAPDSRLFLMSIQPVYPSPGILCNTLDLNALVKSVADDFGAGYVDITTPLCKGGVQADPAYMKGNYVYGKGYLKISRILAESMGLDYVPVTYATRETSFTGRGNEGETLVTLTVSPAGRMRLRRMEVSLDACAADVTALSVRRDGKVLGSVKVKGGKTSYRIRCNTTVDDLTDVELCADIASDAVEGHKVSADIVKVKCGLFKWKDIAAPAPGSREILLRRVKLLGPGAYGSVGYRIPAIVTLPDGTLLTATDKRKNNESDLPEDIDIIAMRSTDGGSTWSDPVTIVEGKGFAKGYGDAALAVSASGDIICAFSGGPGLWASTLENPQGNYISRSTDGGLTWSEPEDCTFRLWGPVADNAECRTSHSAFFGSGRGLCLEKGEHAGRIMFVAAVHSKVTGRFDNYIYYSDDGGYNWKVSECCFRGGDEAKVVELPDGRVLLSVRRRGERGFNISEDGGETWGEQGTWKEMCVNACDGDIIALGDSVLLQSVPNSMQRRNVSIFVSRDNGRTWPYVRTICPYESVYSSMTVLPDGTIGVYLEENPDVSFEMWYVNFSYDWLMNHTGTEGYLSSLYGSMPLPDSLSHPRQWWKRNVEKTLEVRSTMDWNIPEREFEYFVLPLRVNNEGLDDFRTECADELCARVKGMSMYDAVLEINHWCHERVTYKPSDGRTSAPLSTIRYGFGRCGEESVVTVAALRAAGIPARQVYTPRWAHTDDNHAWVEAWVDGKWHFLGACEPEPVLDMGWFNAPVSRAVLLHTNVSGPYDGPESKIDRNELYTEINLTGSYVPVRNNVVKVIDTKGRAVRGATVEFRLYNYAELYPLARYVTGKDGCVSLESGLGDMVAFAFKDGRLGMAKVGSEYTELVLDRNVGDEFDQEFHLVPPPENPLPSYATKEQTAANAERLKQEDVIRAALHPGVVNSSTIENFRRSATTPEEKAKVEAVLGSITQKDFRDITPEVLSDAVSVDGSADPYVLSPRIEMEYLYPFHKEMHEGLKDVVHNYDEAIAWVKDNIRIVEGRNPRNFRIPPVAVWRSRLCDRASLGIFFVAVCRSVGLPARISMADGNIYVRDGEQWLVVDLGEAKAQAVPEAVLHIDATDPNGGKAPEYFGSFTLSRFEGDTSRLMDYEGSDEQFGYDFKLEEGNYYLTSGVRMPDGSVHARIQTFNLKADTDTTVRLTLPSISGINRKADKDSYIEAFLAENGEPTVHALRQLESVASALNGWGGKISVFGPTDKSLEFYRTYLGSLENVTFSIGTTDSDVLPVLDMKAADGSLIYHSQGYNTSLGSDLVSRIGGPDSKAGRMDWFSQAKLGIFIHWGIYSRGDWSESWAFHNKVVSMDDYFAQEADFTAKNYNPREWVSLIKESGAKYTVITSKHHDGVALWDTQAGDVSTVKSCAAGRDVLTPFVDEVRRQGGLKLGLYYSLIDWPREDYPNVFREGPARYDINEEPDRWQHFCDFNFAQMKELNDAYHPDLYWFDGDWEFSSEQWRAPELLAMVRETNPDVIVNSRIQGNGDYATPELGVPVVKPEDEWWETCMTINDSWGFRKQDKGFKSDMTLLRMLVDCMSMGGNLLLDIGPRADGTIPDEEVKALKSIGRWVHKHAEAVYPTRAGIPSGHVQGYTTLNQAGDILYIYLPYAPKESVELKGVKTPVRNVRVVGTDRTLDWQLYNDISWSEVPGVYYINVPANALDSHITVLAVELERPLELYRGSGQVISYNP